MEEIGAGTQVTVLVIARNQADSLRLCLGALLGSGPLEGTEVLVVDDGSDDGTAAVVDEFPGCISLRLPKQLGWTRAANIGMRTAKGEWILFLPANVRVEPAAVEALVSFAKTHSDAGGVCPRVSAAFSLPSLGDLSAAAGASGELPNKVAIDASRAEVPVDYPRGAPILVRKITIQSMNYLDTRFGHHWADLELCWRIRAGGKQIYVLPGVAAEYLQRQTDSEGKIDDADRLHGLATLARIHFGITAGLKLRTAGALRAIGSGRLGQAVGLLTGQKIDGNHV